MIDALTWAVTERRKEEAWTTDTEMLAVLVELTYQVLSALGQLGGSRPLGPFRITRPWDAAPQVMGFGEFARRL